MFREAHKQLKWTARRFVFYDSFSYLFSNSLSTLVSFTESIFLSLPQQSATGALSLGARCSSVIRAFAHGAMGHRIDPSAILSVGWCI